MPLGLIRSTVRRFRGIKLVHILGGVVSESDPEGTKSPYALTSHRPLHPHVRRDLPLSYVLDMVEVFILGTDLIGIISNCPEAACPNLRNVAVAHPHVAPRREGRAFAAATASSHKAQCRRLQQSMDRRYERKSL